MKLTIILLTAAMLNVSAKGLSQKITFSGKDVSLEKVFSAIEKQSNYTFFYKANLLNKANPVTVEFKDIPVNKVLDQTFENQPFTYSLNGRIITIEMKRPAPPLVPPVVLEEGPVRKDISGFVTDTMGLPLPGVSITTKSSGRGTQTDKKGFFLLKGLDEKEVLTFSAIGYDKVSVPVKGKTAIYLAMKNTTNDLDKIVIQAYGITSKRLNTGNIAKVTAEEIEKQPVMNPLLALQGRVPGMMVTSSFGYAHSPVKIEIRGRNTIDPHFTSDPLFIIDGVPLTVLNVSGNDSYNKGSTGVTQGAVAMVGGGQSPFFGINPGDIESMEILKDADATALYGSRGANGVILITSKKGKAGKTKFGLNLTQGMSQVNRHWNMLNTSQYLQVRREAFRNDGITPNAANAPDLFVFDTTRNVDWQKELWGGTGKMTDLAASMSGGDASTTFRINTGYHRQVEILTQSGGDSRASAAFNLFHHSLDQKFTASLTTNYSYSTVNASALPSVTLLSPDAPAIYDSLGKLNYAAYNAAGLGSRFQFGQLKIPYKSTSNLLASNLTLTYELIKGLTLTSSMGYNNSTTATSTQITIASQDPLTNPTGQTYFGNTRNTNWVIEPQLTYSGVIGGGRLNVLAGANMTATITDATSIFGFGYTNDVFIGSVAGAGFTVAGETNGKYRYAALFGRINYNWGNKYILNLNARRDGSSRFGPGKQFGNFGSLGAAWIASEERWLKQILPAAISFVKFRSSYGLTGLDNIGDYQYLSQWTNSTSSGLLLPYNGTSPLVNIHAVNQDYHWSLTKKLEIAMDLGFLKDRVNMGFSWYRNRCNNQLTTYPTPIFTGFPNVTANWPANVENSGLELLVSAEIIKKTAFSWTASFNISKNMNKLLAYPNIENSPYSAMYKVGQPLNNVYLLHYLGVDPQTGQYSFQDRNHNGIISTDFSVPPGTGIDDRVRVINMSPDFFGGINNTLTYKDFRLSFMLSFVKQMGKTPYLTPDPPGSMSNQPADILGNYWQKPGDKATYARLTNISAISDTYFVNNSDGMYTDASYLRLTNLSIGYNLPASWAKKAGMQGCNIYVNTQNVFVITKYKGLDPDVQSFGGMPPAKIITGGISFNF